MYKRQVYISERQKKVRNIKLKISKDDLTGFRQLTKEEKRNFYIYIRRQTKPYRIWKLLFTLYVVAIFVMKFITIRESASSTAPPMPDEIIDTCLLYTSKWDFHCQTSFSVTSYLRKFY